MIKSISKSLISMEDLATGEGKVLQVRANKTYEVGKIDIPYSLTTIDELKELDYERFTYAKVGAVEYHYDPTVPNGDVQIPGGGSWVIQPVNRGYTIAKVSDASELSFVGKDFLTVAERSNAVFSRSVVDDLPNSAMFSDKDGTIWYLTQYDNLAYYGIEANSDIREIMQHAVINSSVITVDKDYQLSDYVYLVSDTIIDFNNKTLTAMPSATRMFIGAKSDNKVRGYDATKRVELKNGILDRNGRANPNDSGTIASMYHMSDVVIRDMVFKSVKNDHAIEVAGCKNFLVTSCEFYDYIAGSRTNVEHIQIESVSTSTGTPAYGPYDDTPSTGVFIRESYFGRSTDSAYSACAAGHHSDTNGSIIRNIIFDSNYVYGSTLAAFRAIGTMHDINITSNTFDNCTALVVQAGNGNSAKNVKFLRNTGYHSSSVNSNSYKDFVRIDGHEDYNAIDIFIAYNEFNGFDGSRGDFVRAESVSNVYINDNDAGVLQRFVSALDASYVYTHNNRANDFSSNVILMDTGSSQLSVLNNTFYNVKSDSAIFVRDTNYIAIKGNKLYDLSARAINLSTDSNYSDVSDNIIRDWAKVESVAGMYIVGGDNANLYDNTFRTPNNATYSIDVSNLATATNAFNNMTVAGSIGHIKLNTGGTIFLSSPDGTMWGIKVNDSGILSAVDVDA